MHLSTLLTIFSVVATVMSAPILVERTPGGPPPSHPADIRLDVPIENMKEWLAARVGSSNNVVKQDSDRPRPATPQPHVSNKSSNHRN